MLPVIEEKTFRWIRAKMVLALVMLIILIAGALVTLLSISRGEDLWIQAFLLIIIALFVLVYGITASFSYKIAILQNAISDLQKNGANASGKSSETVLKVIVEDKHCKVPMTRFDISVLEVVCYALGFALMVSGIVWLDKYELLPPIGLTIIIVTFAIRLVINLRLNR